MLNPRFHCVTPNLSSIVSVWRSSRGCDRADPELLPVGLLRSPREALLWRCHLARPGESGITTGNIPEARLCWLLLHLVGGASLPNWRGLHTNASWCPPAPVPFSVFLVRFGSTTEL